MVFQWLRNRRRQRLRARPFPAAWNEILATRVAIWDALTPEETARARGHLQVFVAEKNWEGCGGLVMSDQVKVTIAAQIALLVLGWTDQYFDRVQSILVYPDAYEARETTVTEAGVVLEGRAAREGEAWYRGPVILSWSDSLAGARGDDDGRNLVLHEFAHQLDMLNGQGADGTPPLETRAQHDEWQRIMHERYEAHVHACRYSLPTVFDDYAATEPSEFFAVATETFFMEPQAMRQAEPELYRIFQQFYRQDPAARAGE